MPQQLKSKTVPAFIPPGTPDPRGHCYICGGKLGVFMWTDRQGTAHTSCVPSEQQKWDYTNATAA